MKIGRIVYKDELVNHVKVDYIEYINGPVPLTETLQADLPTLYVGWNFLKECRDPETPIEISILENRVLNGQLYWEFSFNENKSKHINGVDMFVKNIPYYFFNYRYKYLTIDPIFFNISTIEDLFHYLPKEINHVYNFKDEMLYILTDKNIHGIDVVIYKYFQFDTDEILNKLKLRSSKYFYDENGDKYVEFKKQFNNFDTLKRYMPIFLNN